MFADNLVTEKFVRDGLATRATHDEVTAAIVAALDASMAAKLSIIGGTMTGAIAMSHNKITGLATPTAASDAANKEYIDNIVGDLSEILHAIRGE